MYRAKNMFITAPQNDTSKQTALDNLVKVYERYGITFMVVSQETHQDGNYHLHCVVVVQKQPKVKMETLDACFGKHVNHQACRSTKDVLKYVTKADKHALIYPTTLTLPEVEDSLKLGQSPSISGAVAQAIIDDPDYDVLMQNPGFYLMNGKKVEEFRSQVKQRQNLIDSEVQHEWYYGKTGTGKSRKAREENPGLYPKMCNRWWDHYKGQDVVLIEDFDKEHSGLCHHLKIWGDRYPFLAEHKGGATQIRPKKIIVTSNYSPEEIWENEKDLEPIKRRFKLKRFL